MLQQLPMPSDSGRGICCESQAPDGCRFQADQAQTDQAPGMHRLSAIIWVGPRLGELPAFEAFLLGALQSVSHLSTQLEGSWGMSVRR